MKLPLRRSTVAACASVCAGFAAVACVGFEVAVCTGFAVTVCAGLLLAACLAASSADRASFACT